MLGNLKSRFPRYGSKGNSLGLVMLLITMMSATVRAQPQTTVIGVVEVQKCSVPSTSTLVGSVQPFTRSLIAGEVAGLVESLPVKEGDRLEAGAVICRLRDTTRRLAHAEAVARLNQLEQELAELEAGTRVEEIARAKAELQEAQAIDQKWQQELVRIKKLREQRVANEKEYNDTVADAAAATARLARVKALYDLAIAGPRAEDIAQAQFAVEAQRSIVARLKDDLEQTVIRAPFIGYVTGKYSEVGQWVASGGSIIELIDLERVLVRVDVPESAISVQRVGAPIAVVVEALHETLRGKVAHIYPQADEKARTFPVEIELANESHALKSGMFARARIPAGPTVDSMIVPRDAIIQRQQVYYVVMVGPAPPPAEGNWAIPVPVQVGADIGAWVAISSPAVQPGVPVAVKGHDRIYGPQPVQAEPASVPPPQVGEVPTSQPATAPASSNNDSTTSNKG